MDKIFGLAMCHIGLTSKDIKKPIINKSDENQEMKVRTNFYRISHLIKKPKLIEKQISHRNFLTKTFIFVAVTV